MLNVAANLVAISLGTPIASVSSNGNNISFFNTTFPVKPDLAEISLAYTFS